MRDFIIKERGYNHDIAGSELSLKIASYPITAEYLAARLAGKGKTICELCCGIGITLIKLSKQFEHVIGVDNDPDIILDCETNLTNASVSNCMLLCADIISPQTIEKVKADIVLYDIPYWSDHGGKVDAKRKNPDIVALISAIRVNITSNIVIYTPPSFSYEEASAVLGACDFVRVIVNGKHDRNFIFLGDLRDHTGETTVELDTHYFRNRQ